MGGVQHADQLSDKQMRFNENRAVPHLSEENQAFSGECQLVTGLVHLSRETRVQSEGQESMGRGDQARSYLSASTYLQGQHVR